MLLNYTIGISTSFHLLSLYQLFNFISMGCENIIVDIYVSS